MRLEHVGVSVDAVRQLDVGVGVHAACFVSLRDGVFPARRIVVRLLQGRDGIESFRPRLCAARVDIITKRIRAVRKFVIHIRDREAGLDDFGAGLSFVWQHDFDSRVLAVRVEFLGVRHATAGLDLFGTRHVPRGIGFVAAELRAVGLEFFGLRNHQGRVLFVGVR